MLNYVRNKGCFIVNYTTSVQEQKTHWMVQAILYEIPHE